MDMRSATILLLSLLAVSLLLLSGCSEFAGEAFKIISKHTCKDTDTKTFCKENNVMVTVTKDTSCRVSTVETPCSVACVAGKCVTHEEYDSMVEASKGVAKGTEGGAGGGAGTAPELAVSETPTPLAAPQCNDTVDNDGDGRTDYAQDYGCSSADDDSEADPKSIANCADYYRDTALNCVQNVTNFTQFCDKGGNVTVIADGCKIPCIGSVAKAGEPDFSDFSLGTGHAASIPSSPSPEIVTSTAKDVASIEERPELAVSSGPCCVKCVPPPTDAGGEAIVIRDAGSEAPAIGDSGGWECVGAGCP
jgi:hypothetical protein